MEQLSKLIVARENPSSLTNAARTSVAAVASYLVARLFHLPEAYWAPMSALIAMQSGLGAALPISVQYFVGTAIGAAVGAGDGGLLWGQCLGIRHCRFPNRIALRRIAR